MNHLLKQAKQMQNKVTALQKELNNRTLDVSAGGGMVQIKINGKQEILELKLNPECVDPNDIEMLEELLKTGLNQASRESQEMVNNAMSEVTGGIDIPRFF